MEVKKQKKQLCQQPYQTCELSIKKASFVFQRLLFFVGLHKNLNSLLTYVYVIITLFGLY